MKKVRRKVLPRARHQRNAVHRHTACATGDFYDDIAEGNKKCQNEHSATASS